MIDLLTLSDFDLALIAAFCAIAVMLEAVLLLVGDQLTRRQRIQKIRNAIQEAEAETERYRVRIRERQPELSLARSENNAALAAIKQLELDIQRVRTPREILVHKVGMRGSGPQQLFRAPIRKSLANDADANQRLIWRCDHYVDVWALNEKAAHESAEAAYNPRFGYQLGSFQRLGMNPVAADFDAKVA